MSLYWMKYSPLEANVSPTDPLALDYMAQQLGYLPLPNFTSRTSRARYYSMVCYGLHICEELIIHNNMVFNDKTVMKLFELYEKYWAYAVVNSYSGELKGKELDLRGKRGAVRAYNGKTRSLGDEYRLLSRQLELGGLGAYRSSLEKFGLIKQSSLSLTMKGRELAEKFLPVGTKMRMQYDELIFESIRDKKIIEKQGKASIKLFGEYACLDYFARSGKTTDERSALIKHVIEADEKTLITARMVSEIKDIFMEYDVLAGLEELSNSESATSTEKDVRDSFKTIYSFELFSIELNKMLNDIILNTYDNGGQITISRLQEMADGHFYPQNLQSKALQLIQTPKYNKMSEYYYGIEYLEFISYLSQGVSYEQVVKTLVKLHTNVESKRKSAIWMDVEGDTIMVFSGHEYAKENHDKFHSYKINNLISIIDDLGWQP